MSGEAPGIQVLFLFSVRQFTNTSVTELLLELELNYIMLKLNVTPQVRDPEQAWDLLNEALCLCMEILRAKKRHSG